MILKHAVDRYNIYFAYKPSKINKKIHSSAINFVTVATILLQFNVVFFTALRSGKAVKSCRLNKNITMNIKVCFVLNFQYSTFALHVNKEQIDIEAIAVDMEAIL